MKAIVSDRYGPPDALELHDIDKPAFKDDEVLVRVRAASVNPYDWHLQTGLPYLSRLQFGLWKPVAGMGGDLAGEIEAVGSAVKQFRPGDEVFGEVNGEDDEFSQLQLGSFAEYVAAAEKWVAKKPPHLTFEQAAGRAARCDHRSPRPPRLRSSPANGWSCSVSTASRTTWARLES